MRNLIQLFNNPLEFEWCNIDGMRIKSEGFREYSLLMGQKMI